METISYNSFTSFDRKNSNNPLIKITSDRSDIYIQNEMTEKEITDIVSQRIIMSVKAQFEKSKVQFESIKTK